jgi:hypothetical protein
MAFVYADRVKEQSSTVGLAAMVMTGALAGFQDFATGVGDTNETFYTIFNGGDNSWEVGQGTFSLGTNSLSRDTVISSSNSNNPVNFVAGTKTVFATVASQFFGSVLDAVTHSTLNHTGIPGIPPPESFTSSAHSLVDHSAVPFLLLDDAAHDAIDHKLAPFNLLDSAAHALLDHTGVTGVNNFDATLHGTTNHAGILGVPGPETFTNPVHAATNHAGLPGVGAGKLVQIVRNSISTVVTANTPMPWDNTVPQQTEGNEIITVTITPQSLSNILIVEFTGFGGGPGQTAISTALFRDATANAIAAVSQVDYILVGFGAFDQLFQLRHALSVPSLSPQTYKIRVGPTGGTVFINAMNNGVQLFNGVGATTLTVTEIAP